MISKFIFAILFVVNVGIFYSFFWGERSVFVYCELLRRDAKLTALIQTIDEENRVLSQEIRRLRKEGVAFEQAVRSRINFVKPDEILYLFIDETGMTGGYRP